MSSRDPILNVISLEERLINFNLPHLKCLAEEYEELFSLIDFVSVWAQDKCKELTTSTLSSNVSPDLIIATRIKAGLDRVWEILNTGSWKDVPEYIKHMYTLMSFYSAVHLLVSKSRSDWSLKFIEKCIHTLDKGILLGYNNPHIAQAMEYLIEVYKSLNVKGTDKNRGIEENSNLSDGKDEGESESMRKLTGIQGPSLPSVSRPSLLNFQSTHLWTRVPVKLTDCINHWPALNKWSLDFFRQTAGPRLVPIELGKKYTDEDWSQKLMSLNEFLDNHMKETSHAYLAQHDLLAQIPELKGDICIPDYCYLDTKDLREGYERGSGREENNEETEGREVFVNMWFGPSGTVTPFHWDAKHNLLAQVMGKKRILLVDPDSNMYPYEGLLNNTSRVDPESDPYLLAREFPDFLKHHVQECILEPGQLLYIPPQHWHHVRSLSTSISVSFWFE